MFAFKFSNRVYNTLREEHRVDFDAASVSQPVRELREVEPLKVEANLQTLTCAFHLVRYGHVCRREQTRLRH